MLDVQLKLLKTWDFKDRKNLKADFLYLAGGKDSIDKGCVDWGSIKSNEFRMLGDVAGEIRILYENGMVDSIPLIYGYSIWWEVPWKRAKEPFVSDAAANELLKETLHLKNGLEGSYPYIIRIHLREYPVIKIEAYDNLKKDGYWLEEGLKFGNADNDLGLIEACKTDFDITDAEGFFPGHTIESGNPCPDRIKNNISKLRHRLYTFGEDYASAVAADIPEGYSGASILFTGEPEANITSSVFHHNLADQLDRIDESGLLNESGKNAPEWFYDGIGTWADDFHNYYGKYFTRNKSLQNLAGLGYIDLCNRALGFLDKALMFFPESYSKLQINGQRIPGHWTVVANDPLWYSWELVDIGWPTRYTAEEFGVNHKDFGNPETDGHGISMIAHWKIWVKAGRSVCWVEERWTYIVEAAYYIEWSLSNPELSFSKDGLLYGETEAAMSDFSMYCNVPCYIGLRMYADMAEAAGRIKQAERWRECAGRLMQAIEAKFILKDPVYGEIWIEEPWGGTISFFQDYYGKDVLGALPEKWAEIYRNTYVRNKEIKTDEFFVTGGLGYMHCAFTQFAMLLDNMGDFTKWMKNLARLCYAPRLPRPYIAPECACVDINNGVVQRQGDLGNGFQQAETINTVLMCAGIDDTDSRELKIIPRLPENWNISIRKYPVGVLNEDYSICNLDFDITYPENGGQSAHLTVTSGGMIRNIKLRMGPFCHGRKSIAASIDGGAAKEIVCFISGDSAWAWVDLQDLCLNKGVKITVK